jgi:hypothetical protein
MDGKAVGDLNATDEFRRTLTSVGTRVWNTTTPLVSTSEAMCAFTNISGKFFGEQEFVKIAPSSDGKMWELKMSMGRGSTFVSAGVRCFARYQ